MNKETVIEVERRVTGFLLSLISGTLSLGFGVATYVSLIILRNYFFSPIVEFLLTLHLILSLLVVLGACFIWLRYQTIGGRLAVLCSISTIILFITLHGGFEWKYLPSSLLSLPLIGFYIILSTLGIIGGTMGLERGETKTT
ncbi:MAG: hypothetical protein GWO20_02710 [Candidatus Korarchaeota archaeon]|nr:hypothetical protein [Candidatus Korarchaeota archaeon]NIU82379.1 hypothetical protein [Candidatus Thorarchaeota archaeon]NIW12846.1 hypothetical protein [Candidatus Thorarchaeota archaeon]NIW51047.1 hypothetical protein [Candidatus Korarchaeota archaeon]